MTERTRKQVQVATAYKTVFSSDAGKIVMGDLIKKYILADPIGEDMNITLMNIGMQREALQILRLALKDEAVLRAQIMRAIEQEQEYQQNP